MVRKVEINDKEYNLLIRTREAKVAKRKSERYERVASNRHGKHYSKRVFEYNLIKDKIEKLLKEPNERIKNVDVWSDDHTLSEIWQSTPITYEVNREEAYHREYISDSPIKRTAKRFKTKLITTINQIDNAMSSVHEKELQVVIYNMMKSIKNYTCRHVASKHYYMKENRNSVNEMGRPTYASYRNTYEHHQSQTQNKCICIKCTCFTKYLTILNHLVPSGGQKRKFN